MSELDFQSPDIVWSNHIQFSYELDPNNPAALIVTIQGNPKKFRVFARRDNLSHIMNQTYFVWRCTQPYKSGSECLYFPGHEETPPLPGQHCHQCGNLRAEWIARED